MTTGTEGSDDRIDVAPASLIDALLVYVEPLASDARAVVIGDSESAIADRLLELGARGVHVFDPDPARAANAARAGAPRGVAFHALVDGLEVRAGAFDLAVVPDLAELDDASATIARLRRALTGDGAVVAMGRARLDDGAAEGAIPFEGALGPATLAYGELYDLFATQFEDVSLAGVVPFAGVVFAELGGTEEEAPAVSVDARLAPSPAPSVFVVVASQSAPGETWGDHRRQRPALDPYAIVQLPKPEEGPRDEAIALEAAFAATQLKAELLSAQLEEARGRLVTSDGRTSEAVSRLDRVSSERDSALTRAMELETVLAASQQTMARLEQRVLETEQALLERDADLAHVVEAHAAEAALYEEQLRDRARFVAELEKELVRREQLVKELVASLEESRGGSALAGVFEAAAPPSPPDPDPAMLEVARLRNKLDELASEPRFP